ncbi:uncharacterized protein ASPGLDRAFT_21256 [Aspergillus glaucus CBS 516.65]|uniref:Uncharacterized protein n=1 Tax=Aspergillus glaucus CBS 516.65 TaxID=1160497 RepID=A0A1L9VYU0_ASPGL|nr:hypothetical protein ASPGLDRAFT_21256 [Aspergillus glaucus CBS 516.65]OJJ89100.1 hypothetical protein ASPGLDRAFT_21256 [Aspergillus glaucus CBS 516.65]
MTYVVPVPKCCNELERKYSSVNARGIQAINHHRALLPGLGEDQSSSNSDNDSSTGPQSNNQVNGMESSNDSTQDNINDGSVWLGDGIRVQRGCRYSLINIIHSESCRMQKYQISSLQHAALLYPFSTSSSGLCLTCPKWAATNNGTQQATSDLLGGNSGANDDEDDVDEDPGDLELPGVGDDGEDEE